jgi:hypothetical protein
MSDTQPVQVVHKQQLFSWGRQREGQGARPEEKDDQTWPRVVDMFPVKVKLIASGVDRSIVVGGTTFLVPFLYCQMTINCGPLVVVGWYCAVVYQR